MSGQNNYDTKNNPARSLLVFLAWLAVSLDEITINFA